MTISTTVISTIGILTKYYIFDNLDDRDLNFNLNDRGSDSVGSVFFLDIKDVCVLKQLSLVKIPAVEDTELFYHECLGSLSHIYVVNIIDQHQSLSSKKRV